MLFYFDTYVTSIPQTYCWSVTNLKFLDEASAHYRLSIMYIKTSNCLTRRALSFNRVMSWILAAILCTRNVAFLTSTWNCLLYTCCRKNTDYKIIALCSDNSPFTKLAKWFKQKFRSIKLTNCLPTMSHVYSLA